MTRTIALVCLSIASCAAVGFAEERTWTDTTGRSMKAEFLRLEGTDVVFRKDGKEVTVPISRLSPQDRDAVTALSEQEGADNPFEVVAEDNPFEVVADEKDPSASSSDGAEKPQRIGQRTWTDAQGKQVKAKFVRINGQNVVLNRSGRILSVPYYNLSQADQEYVAELLTERGEEDKVPPPLARGNLGNDPSGSSLGGGSGGPPGMPGASGSFPGGMTGGRYPGGGAAGAGPPGNMPSLPSPPSGMPGGSAGRYPGSLPPGGRGYPDSSPPGSFPGSLPSPGVRGGYPGSMPSTGGYPGGTSTSPFPGSMSSGPPGMAGGSSPSMGPGSSLPGSSSPSYPGTLGGPHGSSSMMGRGSSALGGPSGMAGAGGPMGMSGPPSLPDLPRFEFVYECSQCKRKFSESESKGKKHCPSCGVAWVNQGGTPGTFDKSAPQYSTQWSGLQSFRGARGIGRLVVAAIAFLAALLGGGATALSRWRKS